MVDRVGSGVIVLVGTAKRLALALVLGLFVLGAGTPESHGDGKKDDKDSAVRIRVSAKPGRAKGMVDMITKQNESVLRKRTWSGTSRIKKKITAADRREAELGCWELTHDASCLGGERDGSSVFGPGAPADVMLLDGSLARAMAVNLVATLRFPAPRPVFGPDPRGNEWGMLAVGFPVWLWTEGDTLVSTSVSSGGFTFRMTARWRSTTFHLGDGASLTCTSMTRYSASVRPGAASPTCGHVYTEPSLPKGKYRVRAVADWDVTWSVAGFSGVLPAYNEASADIPIGELVALNR